MNLRGVSKLEALSPVLSKIKDIGLVFVERISLLRTELRTEGVRYELKHEGPNPGDETKDYSDKPVLPRETTKGALHGSSTEFSNHSLTSRDKEPDKGEHPVSVDTLENVLFVVNFSSINHIENLHNDEAVEHVSEVSTGTFLLTVLEP
jgi:hypothetical protein